ncbi:hypothetical protein BDQ12DRAFT_576420, partial [Crucibulum laeve]
NQRTMLNILWSCLSTIFACTWLAVHPNIPAPNDTEFSIARRRAKIMLYAFLAPEIVIFWAIKQRIAAQDLSDTYHEYGWSRTHGFFAKMGGFLLCQQKKPVATLTPFGLQRLLLADLIDFPDITKDEIEDRSKGDLFTKGIALLQSAWFVAQCISRAIQHLALTEMELITLALAALSGAMYFFWWDKPLDVHCSLRVHLKTRPGASDDLWREILRESWTDHRNSLTTLEEIHFSSPYPLDDPIQGSMLPTTTGGRKYDITASPPMEVHHDLPSQKSWLSQSLSYTWNSIRTLALRVIDPILQMMDPDIEAEERIMVEGRTKVPTFHSGFPEKSAGKIFSTSTWLLPVPAMLAAVFGAIHCIAWSFYFPTRLERILWRTSSLIILCIPVYWLAQFFSLSIKEFFLNTGPIVKIWKAATVIIYILARLTLLSLAFASLRTLPSGAYQDVEWAKFFPHL